MYKNIDIIKKQFQYSNCGKFLSQFFYPCISKIQRKPFCLLTKGQA